MGCRSYVNGLSSETSVHTRSTLRHIPQDGILHSHPCENLKSYIITLSRRPVFIVEYTSSEQYTTSRKVEGPISDEVIGF
jgi:hypothetical protein